MKTKIQIKSIYGKVLFEFEKEDNIVRDTVEEAVKQGVKLCGANLCGANLRGADLQEANLRDVCLNGADLRYANLRGANLDDVDFRNAYLYEADLRGASLTYANFYEADLTRAYLGGANILYANLSGAINVPYIPMNCPSEGSFIGWKKVARKLVKLEIPENARRSSATSMKCRCEKAKVLSITDLDGSHPIDEVLNTSQCHELLYKVGKMVYPDYFDDDRWNECSHGIHFFINKQDAINY